MHGVRDIILLTFSAHGRMYHCMTPTKNLVSAKQTIVTLQAHERSHRARGSTQASLVKIRSDMNWTSLLRRTYPYYVGSGLSSRATCRSCGYQFAKEETRVRTTLLRKMSAVIRPCEINLCINLQCINLRSFMKTDRNNPYLPWVRVKPVANTIKQIKPFLGKIRVPAVVTESLPVIDGIEWIYEEKWKIKNS